jgi:hypothetical protein
MPPTADDFATKITAAMKTPNYWVIANLRDKEDIPGWLNIGISAKDIEEGDKDLKESFDELAKCTCGYVLGECYGGTNLKDRLGLKTLGVDEAVESLRRENVEKIADALDDFSTYLVGDRDRIKNIAAQLREEIKVLCETVERIVEESHKTLEVGHYNVATGSGASAAPPSHQPGGDGYQLVKLEDFTDTNNNKATWTFGLRCVNDAETAYVLPDTDSTDPWHWRLDKDEPVVVEVQDADQPKTTKAKDNFAPNKDKIKDPNDDGLKKKFVEGLLEKWPTKQEKWYPLAGPDTDAPPPDSHKIPIREKEKDGYLWTFNMAWVDEDEEMYVKNDHPKKHHLAIAKGEKVVVALQGEEDVTKETTTSDWLKLDDADEGGDKAIEELLKNGGADRWYPQDASTDSPPPDKYKVHVAVGRESNDHKWSFAVAWVDADEKVFVKKASPRADHVVIASGETIVVGRLDGRGDPKETQITKRITVVGGGTDDDAIAEKAIEALLEEDGGKWFPASLEDQQASKEADAARQRADDLGKAVTAKVDALKTAAGRMAAFVRAHLSTANRRQRPVVPPDKIQQAFGVDWPQFATQLTDASQLGVAHETGFDQLRECVRTGLALVTEAEDLGGTAPQLDNIAQLCRDLNGALDAYASA